METTENLIGHRRMHMLVHCFYNVCDNNFSKKSTLQVADSVAKEHGLPAIERR